MDEAYGEYDHGPALRAEDDEPSAPDARGWKWNRHGCGSISFFETMMRCDVMQCGGMQCRSVLAMKRA